MTDNYEWDFTPGSTDLEALMLLDLLDGEERPCSPVDVMNDAHPDGADEIADPGLDFVNEIANPDSDASSEIPELVDEAVGLNGNPQNPARDYGSDSSDRDSEASSDISGPVDYVFVNDDANAGCVRENNNADAEGVRENESPAGEIPDPEDSDVDPEFDMDSDIDGNSLPNDEMWKKFGLDVGVARSGMADQLNNYAFGDMINPPWLEAYQQQQQQQQQEDEMNNSREIRNHDCMWAGTCSSDKHETNNQRNQKCATSLPPKRPRISQSDDMEMMALITVDGPSFAERPAARQCVVAPTHERSVLLPTRVVNATTGSRRSSSSRSHTVTTNMLYNRPRPLDTGGDSPRPETPQSLTDEDLNLDLADMKTVEDLVADTFGYNFINDIVQNIGNEGSNNYGPGDDLNAGQNERLQQGAASSNGSSSNPPPRNAGNRLKRPAPRQEAPVPRHYTDHSFFSDHCYHLNKNTRMDSLGVQTPSDSEEEIDVETVCGDVRKPNSRSSSSGSVLPTNPSLSDRQQLQLTVASAISKKDVRQQGARTATQGESSGTDNPSTSTGRGATGARRRPCGRNDTRRAGGTKRRANSDDAEEAANRPPNKRRRYQAERSTRGGRGRSRRPGRNSTRSVGVSSDSEVDSIERRSIHNSMERQRRIDLRNSFEELRKLIPQTADNEKAAKVLILCSGAEYCRALAREDHLLSKRRAELRREQEALLARVSQLRKALAARR